MVCRLSKFVVPYDCSYGCISCGLPNHTGLGSLLIYVLSRLLFGLVFLIDGIFEDSSRFKAY